MNVCNTCIRVEIWSAKTYTKRTYIINPCSRVLSEKLSVSFTKLVLLIWSLQQIKEYQLASKQLQFVLIYYIRIITDISLIISEIIISLQILNGKKYINLSKQQPTIAEFFILKYAYITRTCIWSRNIGWLLQIYSSVRFHFWSRNNIEAFPLAQRLKFCYQL